MKALIAPLLVGLVACASTNPPDVIFELPISVVNVPASIKLSDSLQIAGQAAGSSGCVTFEKVEAERTAQHLTLRILGRRPGGNVPCTANAPIFPFQYTDLPTPARSNPFEVVVNGQKYGVAVQP